MYHDAYCRVTSGDKVGFGVFETANNIRGGTLLPTVFHDSITNGWHAEARPFLA